MIDIFSRDGAYSSHLADKVEIGVHRGSETDLIIDIELYGLELECAHMEDRFDLTRAEGEDRFPFG